MQLRIRDMREDADLTQQQVADYLHCDQSLYSKYERGERAIPLAAMIELAKQEQIQLIDLNTKSRTLFQELGPDGTRELFMLLEPGQSPNYPNGVRDNIHFSEAGARQMAMLVAEGIMESTLEPLKQHLRK